MKIYEVKERDEALIATLLDIWESSVRATHHFLTDKEIRKIKGYVPQALQGVKHLLAAENECGKTIAFMGVENDRLEMLFLLPDERGHGIGRQLLEYGIKECGIQEVTVNEQNPQAAGFYRHMRFETYKRTDLDEEGNPYALLYMSIACGR